MLKQTGIFFRRRYVAALALLVPCVLGLLAVTWSGGSDSSLTRLDIEGRNVFLLRDRGSGSATVHVAFSCGECTLPDAPAGLLHYTEHLAWKSIGGSGLPAEQRHSNAWTNSRTVGYWLSGPARNFVPMLKTLSGLFEPLSVTQDFAVEERGIVLREYEARLTNNPDGLATEDMNAFLYEGNSLARSVIGLPDDISAFDYEAAKRLHAATHLPENAIVIVRGDFSADEVEEGIRRSGFPAARSGEAPSLAPFTPAAPTTREFSFDVDAAAPRMIWRKVVTLDAPVEFDLLEIRTRLLADILGSSLPGSLGGKLHFETFVARSFALTIVPLDERHIELRISAEPDGGVQFAKLRAALEEAVGGLAGGIPAGTWDRIRTRFEARWPDWNDADKVDDWMMDYALGRVTGGRFPVSETALRAFDGQIGHKDIDALARALSAPGRTAIAYIGKEGG